MKVKFKGKEVNTDAKRIDKFLEEQGINPETVVVKKNGEIVPDDEKLEDGDEIDTIRVVSGG